MQSIGVRVVRALLRSSAWGPSSRAQRIRGPSASQGAPTEQSSVKVGRFEEACWLEMAVIVLPCDCEQLRKSRSRTWHELPESTVDQKTIDSVIVLEHEHQGVRAEFDLRLPASRTDHVQLAEYAQHYSEIQITQVDPDRAEDANPLQRLQHPKPVP